MSNIIVEWLDFTWKTSITSNRIILDKFNSWDFWDIEALLK